MTGIMAFCMLVPLGWLVDHWMALGRSFDPQLSLVAFHTVFNFLGVVLSIGLTRQFADLIIWIIPDRAPHLASRLDKRLLDDPGAAVDAAAATLADISRALFGVLSKQLVNPDEGERQLDQISQAGDETRQFLGKIRTLPENAVAQARHEACIHALDHLNRLRHRCGQTARLDTIRADEPLAELARDFHAELNLACVEGMAREAEGRLNQMRQALRQARRSYRETTIAAAAVGDLNARHTQARLDGIRWLHRAAYHVWRIVHHTGVALGEAPAEEPPQDAEIELTDD
jgi:phosphate:Na+ symporter